MVDTLRKKESEAAMEQHICPYCNGMEVLEMHCPACKQLLNDCGTLQEALGPYAPYEENSFVNGQFECIHQVFCSNCNVEYHFTVPT
jgi:alkylhydroperoxidase/carboxymuconolactone decarboxylase family protein YurZ